MKRIDEQKDCDEEIRDLKSNIITNIVEHETYLGTRGE